MLSNEPKASVSKRLDSIGVVATLGAAQPGPVEVAQRIGRVLSGERLIQRGRLRPLLHRIIASTHARESL